MNQQIEDGLTANVEPFLTIKEAATKLGLPYFKMQRAVRSGLIESYRIFNKRRLVRLSEVVAAIERSRHGGGDE